MRYLTLGLMSVGLLVGSPAHGQSSEAARTLDTRRAGEIARQAAVQRYYLQPKYNRDTSATFYAPNGALGGRATTHNGTSTFYGPNGALSGRATTHNGNTTFYAPNGPLSGRATTHDGSTSFYGPNGALSGRANAR
jgi:hypothetical protein